MGVYSNNRPAKIWPQLAEASPLKKSVVDKGIDFIIVRELIGGIYFGEHKTEGEPGQQVATDLLAYHESEIERIGRIGFETARKEGRAAVLGGKEQRARFQPPVEEGHAPAGGAVSRRAALRHVCGQLRHADCQGPLPV